MFAFAVSERYLSYEDVPERLEDINKPRVNKRYLSIAEIETLLQVTSVKGVRTIDGINDYDAMLLRLLLLTGCRLKPMRLAQWSDMGNKLKGFWTFPANRNKQTTRAKAAPEDHLVPVTDLLQSELNRLAEVSGDYPVLFPERYAGSREAVKVRSEGWAKHVVVDHALQLKNTGEDAYGTHALRRTMNNVMRELEIPDEVIHVCNSRVPKGVDATYLTTKLRPQCIVAYEKYHAFIAACMQGKGDAWMEEVTKEKRSALRKQLDGISKKLKLKPIAGIGA
jgi:integrase